jgi:hypothetical protein
MPGPEVRQLGHRIFQVLPDSRLRMARPASWPPSRLDLLALHLGPATGYQSLLQVLLPLIDRRVEQKKSPSKSDQEGPLDIVQGLLEMDIPSPEEAMSLRHAHRVLHLTFATSAVSSALILHTLHQTLTTPEHTLELLEEISRCLKEYGGWTEKALLNMQFFGSYIREMLRLCPPSIRKYFRWEM